ncbi:MAG TPA: molybdate ABC transporter permease subunit [Parvibaculum sp.]|uniref:molybdate ABC transporter permease subunit n=1 Tax=Parvibaculum sp. TaxID=2024848 RepID=UPI002CB554BD|nr:molybdate ABC transporter permease subunit [Parvibaculum sp.]HMM13518.1 molybdate ABC transporter permease subunit [Parvibaculum sp.]
MSDPGAWLTPGEAEALWLSLKTGLAGTALSLPPGIVVAWVLARRNFPGKIILDGLVHLPLVLPPVVTGYLLLVLFGHGGAMGQFLERTFGLVVAFNWKGAALASAVMGFPLLVRAIRLAFEAVDPKLEAAARTLGASPADVFMSVTLPLITPGLIAGALLGFARALGEFGATITFVANIPGETQTLPLALYSALQVPGGGIDAARFVILSLVLAIAALGASEYFARAMRRRIGVAT